MQVKWFFGPWWQNQELKWWWCHNYHVNQPNAALWLAESSRCHGDYDIIRLLQVNRYVTYCLRSSAPSLNCPKWPNTQRNKLHKLPKLLIPLHVHCSPEQVASASPKSLNLCSTALSKLHWHPTHPSTCLVLNTALSPTPEQVAGAGPTSFKAGHSCHRMTHSFQRTGTPCWIWFCTIQHSRVFWVTFM